MFSVANVILEFALSNLINHLDHVVKLQSLLHGIIVLAIQL
jgi:hypothetical protein